ncbi:MAG TPA: hypothetical protein ENJ43_00325 [Gammaproteobacteria bacterium]|nr:hypothetical protein [Gammaproteobacteria bacterium]
MKYPKIAYRNGKRYFYRFSLVQRIQHIVLFTTVITLSLTGFPLRYYDKPWAEPLYNFFGGIEVAPWIHRIAGSILLGLFLFHTGYWIYLFFKNRIGRLKRENQLTVGNAIREFFSQEMIPNAKDGRDLVDMFKYLLYLSDRPPRYDRMSWKEKFDYFAPYWGIPILGPAGVALWFRDEITHYVPGIVLNAFYIMHTDEALLAALFLFFVHWYNVHYSPEKFPLGTVFLTGYLSEADMIHEHYAEYVKVMKEEGLENEIKPQGHH